MTQVADTRYVVRP